MSFQARKKTVKRRREEKPPCDLGVLLSEYMSLRGREGEAVISQLLRASIGLQKAFDRRFAYAGLTAQEAGRAGALRGGQRTFRGENARCPD
ncbi:MAG: hypothetical protein DMG42_07845 [Acidobacteria bacterium]|nr:MAG: hypothetical protein DMG42_07845 [Acidobacteriota bacterium]